MMKKTLIAILLLFGLAAHSQVPQTINQKVVYKLIGSPTMLVVPKDTVLGAYDSAYIHFSVKGGIARYFDSSIAKRWQRLTATSAAIDTTIYNSDGKIPDSVSLRTFDVNEKHLLFKKAGWVQFQYPDNGYLNQPSDFFSGSNAEITRYEYEYESPVGKHLLGDLYVSPSNSLFLVQGNSDTGVIFTNAMQINEAGIHLRAALSSNEQKGLHVEGFGQIRIDTLSAAPGGAIKAVVWDSVTHNLYATTSSGGGGSTDTTSLSNRINLKVNISDTAAMLNPYLRKLDTAQLSLRIDRRVKYTDTAAMMVGYQKACQIITLTDGATITWNYSTSCAAKVTIAAVGRVLSITGLPSDRVSWGSLTVIQDPTGGRSILPPAGFTNRGGNNMNLIGGQPLNISTTGGSVSKVVFEYDPITNTLFWTTQGNYN